LVIERENGMPAWKQSAFVIHRRQVPVACGTGTNHSGAGECNFCGNNRWHEGESHDNEANVRLM